MSWMLLINIHDCLSFTLWVNFIAFSFCISTPNIELLRLIRLSIKAFSIMTLSISESQHKHKVSICSVLHSHCYSEYHYAECCYTKCHYVERRNGERCNVEYRYAKCRCAQCHYTKCRGAQSRLSLYDWMVEKSNLWNNILNMQSSFCVHQSILP